MKVVAIPTIVSGLTAVLSVLFFTGLSRVIGDDLLGRVILVQSSVGMVIMFFVPQCWVYIIAAQDRADLIFRYRHGFSIEAAGFMLGAVVIAAALTLPMAERWSGGLVIFASLAVQASSSCLGWLRATESWSRYSLWVLGPNLIRVPLIWATPWLVAQHWLPDASGEQTMVMVLYFLVPDMVRWLAIATPIAVRNYRWPGFHETFTASRFILQNWLFDVGSAVTELADKVVVGTLLGPQTLVAYFFARRLGIVATMVCEPFYAEQYRRTVTLSDPLMQSQRQTVIYRQGLGIASLLCATLFIALAVATMLPPLKKIVPTAVLNLLPLFAIVLLVDCLMAANRWSRFVAQMSGGNSHLLGVRIAVFGLFVANVWLFGNLLAGLGLALAFALSWLLEAAYLSALLRTVSRSAISRKTNSTSIIH